jgi:hypothetical protein
MEVEMNHCVGQPSKGYPLKMNIVVKKDINKDMQGEMWKDNSKN